VRRASPPGGVKPPLDRSDGWQRLNNGLEACYLLTSGPCGFAGGGRRGPAAGRGAVRARLRRNDGANYGRRRLHGGAGAAAHVQRTLGAARHASARQFIFKGYVKTPECGNRDTQLRFRREVLSTRPPSWSVKRRVWRP
jgi:hypothetical protein